MLCYRLLCSSLLPMRMGFLVSQTSPLMLCRCCQVHSQQYIKRKCWCCPQLQSSNRIQIPQTSPLMPCPWCLLQSQRHTKAKRCFCLQLQLFDFIKILRFFPNCHANAASWVFGGRVSLLGEEAKVQPWQEQVFFKSLKSCVVSYWKPVPLIPSHICWLDILSIFILSLVDIVYVGFCFIDCHPDAALNF